jgi:hypothetical protein
VVIVHDIKHIVHLKQFSLLLCGGGFLMCDIFPHSVAAVTKVTCINILCCILCNCHTLCDNMSSFLLNTCVVSSIVEHFQFVNTGTLHCKVPHSI